MSFGASTQAIDGVDSTDIIFVKLNLAPLADAI